MASKKQINGKACDFTEEKHKNLNCHFFFFCFVCVCDFGCGKEGELPGTTTGKGKGDIPGRRKFVEISA